MVNHDKPATSRQFIDPINFLLAVMNDPTAAAADRLDAATALMPYFHESIDDAELETTDE